MRLRRETRDEVVLQVGADLRRVDDERDAVLGEVLGRPDAAQHQQLGRVDRTAGEDHLAPREGVPHDAADLDVHPGGARLGRLA